VTFFPLSYISHLQFDFLDLSSSLLLLLNDDKIYRRETAFFLYTFLFKGVHNEKETTLKTGDKRIMSFLFQRRKKEMN